MAAATNPLQTLSRRAGNYAPKATTSPALLGGAGEESGQDGSASRRGVLRVGTAQGGRSIPSARQGQLPFDTAQVSQDASREHADREIAPIEVPTAEQVVVHEQVVVQEQVVARESVVIRRRELVVERTKPATSSSGLRVIPKTALRRIVLDDLEDRQPKVAVTQERVPAPRREMPLVLEAVGTVAVTALGLAALLFLG